MADPLSIAAGIAGLVKATSWIAENLYKISKSAKRAPQECTDVRTEVEEIRNILDQLKRFLLGTKRASASRTSLILVDQVIATLAATVTTISELEVFVDALASDEDMGLMDRFRWLSKEEDLKELLHKIHLHKGSLNLMLTILTCQSTMDAEDKVDKLCVLVEQTLKQNSMLVSRLWSSQVEPAALSNITSASDIEGCPLENATNEAVGNDDATLQGQPRRLAFEEHLMESRAYRRIAFDYNDTVSIMSSAGRTASWSMLSGLSLSQVSKIAILALPIYASDLSNKEHYDFDELIDESALPVDPATEVSKDTVQRVMGVPMECSMKIASAEVVLSFDGGRTAVHGFMPTIVIRCGGLLKAKGLDVRNIFATPGHPVRVKALERIFDSPPKYGRDVSWQDFKIHDAAALLIRYLKSLPEPVIPRGHYDNFTRPFRDLQTTVVAESIDKSTLESLCDNLRGCIDDLPSLNRMTLLYLLGLFGKFVEKRASNSIDSARLVSVFHPAILSQTPQKMNMAEHQLAQEVVVFLTDHISKMAETLYPFWIASRHRRR